MQNATSKSVFEGLGAMEGTKMLSRPVYHTVHEAMPHVQFVIDGAAPIHPSDLFVVGTVVSVEPGVSYAWPNGPDIVGQPSGRKVLPFNDKAAATSDLALVLDVETAADSSGPNQEITRIKIGVGLGARVDLKAIGAEMPPGKRVVALVVSNERSAFDLHPGWYGVAGGGRFLGFVSDDGGVTFPNGGDFVADPTALTVDSLLATPAGDPISVATIDGELVRQT